MLAFYLFLGLFIHHSVVNVMFESDQDVSSEEQHAPAIDCLNDKTSGNLNEYIPRSESTMKLDKASSIEHNPVAKMLGILKRQSLSARVTHINSTVILH